MIDEIISIKELRKVLLEIDNCTNDVTHKYVASDEQAMCNMEVLCDSCIERMAGLLNWAEDTDMEVHSAEVMQA